MWATTGLKWCSAIVLALFGAAAVPTGPGVGGVLGVSGGGAVSSPVEVVVLVLSEHADRLLLEAAVKLPWEHTQEIFRLCGVTNEK